MGSVGVEHAAHTLEHPVGNVLVSLQVGLEDHAHAHSVSSRLCDVDGGPDGAAELELVGLDWYNLHQWKLLN